MEHPITRQGDPVLAEEAERKGWRKVPCPTTERPSIRSGTGQVEEETCPNCGGFGYLWALRDVRKLSEEELRAERDAGRL